MKEKEMLETPAARPEFTALSETDVRNALEQDEDGGVSAEVTRLVAGYTRVMMACADRHGPVPPEILHITVRWPIERVAVLMLIEFWESEGGVRAGRFTLH